ncbi:Hint domain-containing protein [Paracoccus litorisediminis]|nr:Hint domain-containing protein [Paracoccus litorisediminis]
MVSYVLDPNAIATGEFIPGIGGSAGTIDPEGYPVTDFVEAMGGDPANAQIIVSVEGSAEDYADGIPPGTLITLEIDVDGDGVGDYEIRPAGQNQSELRLDNQISGNAGFFDGDFGIYAPGSDVPLSSGSGRFFLTTEPGGFTDDGLLIEPGDNLNMDDVDVLPCFTRGSLIDTPDGPRLVEELALGDLVMTKDHGPQPIRWIASRLVGGHALDRHPNFQPIRIAAGAFGPSVPARDLVVSPQHRVLLSSRIVQAMFGTDEVLVAAKKLLGLPGVTQENVSSVEYFHILLDRHEVVRANGAWTETLLTGPMALKALGPEAVREISLLFPELASPSYVAPPARRIAEPRRVAQMIARHLKNQRDLVEIEKRA